MTENLIVWLTGTVTGASGYPRKNAEVRGVLYDGERRIATAMGQADYSGQYCLAIEVPSNAEVSSTSDELRVALSATASGDFEEYAADVVWLDGGFEQCREIQLARATRDRESLSLQAAA